MERLLKDAQALTGVKYDINNLADVYSAIHAIQEQLGIAGTTMKEAETTITGSIGMVKASWQNLLTAMSGGGDLDRAINNFVYSFEKLAINIMPVIERTLAGMGMALQKTLPMLVQTVVSALVQQIPNIVAAVYSMIVGLFKGIVLGIKALFTGGTAKATQEIKGNVGGIANDANTAADKMNDVASATKKAGKEAKKSMASFDELNVLADPSSKDKEDSSAGTTPEMSLPSVGGDGGGGGLLGSMKDFTQEIDAQLTAIMAIAGVSLIAIGLLLLFFGQIAWGIGMIVVGAITFGVAAYNSSKGGVAEEVISMMTTIMGIAGGALLALGIILVYFNTAMPTAIGMIVAGAALIISAVVTKGIFNPDDIKGWLSLIMGIAGGALLAIGIMLCYLGVTQMGISLIVAGAVSLVSAIALNSNGIVDGIKNFLKQNTELIVGVASALLALGIILCAFGVISPLSIGLIVAGAGVLAAEVKLNPKATEKVVKDFFKDNAGLIVGISLAILILGVVLCCCGVVTPLSIGLIVAGAVGLVTEIALNWNAIKDAIVNFLKDNAGLIVGISLALLILGIVMCVCGLITPLSIGLIVAGAAGLATEVALNWNAIKTAITDFLKNNSGLIVGVSLALLVLGIILCCTGVALPLGIGLISVGAAGLATEAALNWNTIKENISETFTSIVDWIKTWGILVLGIILTLSGISMPLGLALIKQGGANLTEAQDPLWTTIVDKVKEIWELIKTYWNKNIAPVFTAEWWKKLGKKVMNGLVEGFASGINGIIGMFEEMINWIIDGLNTLEIEIPEWVPGFGGETFGVNLSRVKFDRVKIPKLAKGAVIPPNKEFLAVLGDQKHGTNIEAPLDTIKQAFRDELQNMGGVQKETVTNIKFTGSLAQLARVLKPEIERETMRQGTELISGGTY
jgi:hypothetical protein